MDQIVSSFFAFKAQTLTKQLCFSLIEKTLLLLLLDNNTQSQMAIVLSVLELAELPAPLIMASLYSKIKQTTLFLLLKEPIPT